MVELSAARPEDLARLRVFAGHSGAQLEPLAAHLRPLAAEAGTVLMRQGEPALTFLLIGSGRVQINHAGPDGEGVISEVGPGLIVGEIALLRRVPRIATVVAAEPLIGWVGDQQAFTVMLELNGMMDTLVRIARQRIALFITPIPINMRDKSVLYLRPVLPGDSAQVAEGSVEFSNQTLYRRFQSMGAPNPTLMRYLFAVDYVDHFVWVLTDPADGPVVADARFVRDTDDPTTAEAAFLVGDHYQGRGAGSFLMEALAVAAACGGVGRFTAQVLADNYAMRTIFNRYEAHWRYEDVGVVGTDFEVPHLRDLSISRQLYRRIYDMARQVMRTVG